MKTISFAATELTAADLSLVTGGGDQWELGDRLDGCTVVRDAGSPSGMAWSCDALTDGWTPSAGE